MSERTQQDDESQKTTEDLMKSAPPPSVLGDVEDAVTPEVDGELTPWSSSDNDSNEGDE